MLKQSFCCRCDVCSSGVLGRSCRVDELAESLDTVVKFADGDSNEDGVVAGFGGVFGVFLRKWVNADGNDFLLEAQFDGQGSLSIVLQSKHQNTTKTTRLVVARALKTSDW